MFHFNPQPQTAIKGATSAHRKPQNNTWNRWQGFDESGSSEIRNSIDTEKD